MKTTWKPYEKHGKLTAQSDLPNSVFAFPKQRKEPLTDARHIRNAVVRFDQVIGVSDALSETSWHDFGAHPQPHRKISARKGAATCKRKAATRKKNRRR